MEQHPTISSRRREQARAWLDRVNVEVDLPPQNEGGMGAADIATTSNHPLDQSRSTENPNIRVPSLPNLEMPYATIGNGDATATTTITTTTASAAGTIDTAASATSTNKPASIAYSGTPAWE
ncbi:hypothetical protein Taro_001447, partial [Colocasia esculenta]|nr:hypothetical protein [Colocasia esculenta]